MLLCDMNPFIRFAEELVYVPTGRCVCPNDSRIFQIVSGTGSLVIQNETYPLKEHTFVMINAGYPYQIQGTERLNMYVLNFDLDFERSDIDSYIALSFFGDPACRKGKTVDDCEMLNDPIVLDNMAVIEPKFLEIMQVYASQRRYYREQSACLLKELLISVVQNCLTKGSRVDCTSADLIRYLQEHYSEEIDCDILSKRFYYHPYHLNRMMRAASGTTVHQYLINYRISVAKGLLIKTDKSIEQIAIEVGFENPAHFSNSFRKSVGCAPSLYRRKYLEFL